MSIRTVSTLFRKTTLAIFISAGITGCLPEQSIQQPQSLNQQQLAAMADTLQVRYQVIDNSTEKKCDPQRADGFCFRGELQLSTDEGIFSKDWAMYFSDMTPIQSIESTEFTVTHVNGDLHRLEPGPDFKGISPGQTISVPFYGSYWHLSKTDIMPNYYLVSSDLKPEIVASTMPQQDPDTGQEILPHAGKFNDPEKHLKRTPQDQTELATSHHLFDSITTHTLPRQQLSRVIIPTPAKVTFTDEQLSLADGIKLTGDIPDDASLAPPLAELQRYGVKQQDAGITVSFTQVSEAHDSPEWYRLDINNRGIEIQMNHTTGAVYALRSLASLLFSDSTHVPQLSIEDSPRYPFRGMHLDVARNFRDKDYVIHLLEQMARYKLNRLHLHLGDDEGWRLAINGLPELTDIGSRRCHDPAETRCLIPQLGSGPNPDNQANGYYTREDFIEILQAAQARHIEVIPSFDMPGHSRAAVVSMEARYQRLMSEEKASEAAEYRLIDPEDTTQYESVQFYHDNTINVCLDSSYRFIDKVLNDVQAVYQEAGVSLTRYHIGADETAGAWIESPACQALLNDPSLNLTTSHDLTGYFIERVSNMVADKGIVPAGWNDGMSATRAENMPSTVQSNAWTPLFWDGHNSAHEQANRQWQVVISTPDVTYFDFPYTADPMERGYYWGSRATSVEQVFDFMPDNLPAHAELWPDRQGNPMVLDDTDSQLSKGAEFYGLQGHLWTEVTRTDQQADYMIFPRLTALAERAWHKAEWELNYNYSGQTYSPDSNHFSAEAKKLRDQQWNLFANTLAQKEMPKLDLYRVAYRIPTVGAKIIDGKLQLKSPLPGLPLQYQDTFKNWHSYHAPISATGTPLIRAQSADNKRHGRALPTGNVFSQQ